MSLVVILYLVWGVLLGALAFLVSLWLGSWGEVRRQEGEVSYVTAEGTAGLVTIVLIGALTVLYMVLGFAVFPGETLVGQWLSNAITAGPAILGFSGYMLGLYMGRRALVFFASVE